MSSSVLRSTIARPVLFLEFRSRVRDGLQPCQLMTLTSLAVSWLTEDSNV